MADQTKIQWTDASWNPIRGCSRVSEGCRNCYAERQAARFCGPGQPYEGVINPDNRKWTGKIKKVWSQFAQPLRWQRERLIFVNSMSDMFHPNLGHDTNAALWGIMAAASQHTFQVLTKRPKRAMAFFQWLEEESRAMGRDATLHNKANAALRIARRDTDKKQPAVPAQTFQWPPPNVWLGVSVEDQASADTRIPKLLQCPAAVRFISLEPMLGPVDLSRHLAADWAPGLISLPPLDWVIVGGESGPGSRPCHLAWIRDVVQQCKKAGVPVFVKQMGSIPVTGDLDGVLVLSHPKGGDPAEWPLDLRVRMWPGESYV